VTLRRTISPMKPTAGAASAHITYRISHRSIFICVTFIWT
jgi:hypothetical protein